MRHAAATWALVFALLSAWFAPAEAQETTPISTSPIKRWAIVSDAYVSGSGLPDLVFAELVNTDLELVERSALATVAEEQTIQALIHGKLGERLKLGALLHADGLIIISAAQTSEPGAGSAAQVTICECRQGVRLGSFSLELGKASAHADAMAKSILDTCHQFSDGVKQVVGVSPFACRNIQHDFDRLQKQYVDYLSSQLFLTPGIALLEFQEARSLLQEFNAGIDAESRVVPILVEADYTVDDSVKPPSVRIVAKLTVAEDSSQQMDSGNLPMEAAGNWITHELADKILEHSGNRATPIALSDQKGALIDRAEHFSNLGDVPHAIQCREALMLVDPLNANQRLQLIDEIQLQLAGVGSQSSSAPPVLAPPSRERRDAQIGQQSILLMLVLEHYSFLVENKLVDRSVAIEHLVRMDSGMPYKLADGPSAMAEYRFASSTTRSLLDSILAANRRFVLEVAPKIPKLTISQGLTDEANVRELLQWQDCVMLRVKADILLRGGTMASLEYLEKAVRQVVTEELPTSHVIVSVLRMCEMNYRISAAPLRVDRKAPFQREEAIFGPPNEEFVDLLTQMRQSEHVQLQLYGQFALLEMERVQGKSSSPSILEKLDDLIGKAEGRPFAKLTNIYGINLDGVLLAAKTMRNTLTPSTRPMPPEPKVVVASQGRLQFDKISLDFSAFGYEEMQWINCDGEFDLIADSKRIAVLRSKDQLETIIELNKPGQLPISHCRWDGKLIWLAFRGGDVDVFDASGNQLQHVDQSNGLPPHDQDLQLFPIEPGRVLAYGRHGTDQRCWLAMIDFDSTKAKVNVFFEARRKLDPFVRYTTQQIIDMQRDMSMTFFPTWFSQCRQANRHIVFLGRSQMAYPFKIDLDSLKVSLSNFGRASAETDRKPLMNTMVVSGDKIFKSYRIGVASLKMLESSAEPTVVSESFIGGEQIPEWFDDTPTLLEQGPWIYKPGAVWFRFRPDSELIERLVPTKLPNELSQMEHATSSQFGLVGWKIGTQNTSSERPVFYQIQIQE